MITAVPTLRSDRCPPTRSRVRGLALACCLGMAGLAAGLAATAPGTIITNQATVSFGSGGGSVHSNLDQIEVVEGPGARTPAQITIWRQDAANTELSRIRPATSNGQLVPLPPSLPVESDGSALLGTSAARSFRSGEPVFIELVDWDQNTDPAAAETVEITVANGDDTDRERYVFTETGPNTGRFTAYVPTLASSLPGDGAIAVAPESLIVARYTDPVDETDAVATQALFDPFGKIFDSATGSPIDGVSITIVDAATGLPASVYGNDGHSAFPSTVTSGATVHDASGAVYTMPAGSFVFPTLAPGSYRYTISLPERSGYTFPTTATDEALQALPGAPFALSPASRGSAFTLNLDPVETDIPLDPDATALMLGKRALSPTASNGDHVAYEITASNQRSLAPMENLEISDRLPAGFRLEADSLRLDGQPVQATIAGDGRSFSIMVPSLAPGASTTLRYLARVTAAPTGQAINRAVVRFGPLESNVATATIIVRDELMATRAHILGRVVQQVDGRPSSTGLPGIAVVLETGSMSVTDPRGFFRFEGVEPGTHIVQLDTTTLPAGAIVVPSADAPTARQRPWSRFVDVAAGTLWNVEFAVRLADNAAASTPTPQSGDNDPARDPATPARYDRAWIATEPVNADWLLPVAGDAPPTPVTRIVVKHPVAHKVTALLNGAPVPAVNFDGVLTHPDRSLAASVWSGVNLREGTNEIEIIRTDSFGNERGREKRLVYFAAPPVRAEFAHDKSTLVADGVTHPVIAVRLFDREGRPARQGVRGRFDVDEPYQAFRDEELNLRLLPGALPEAPEFLVEEDGIARIRLEPTATSGRVRVRFALVSGAIEVLADLRADRREWIVVGLAEGTAAHRTISGHLESAAEAGLENGWAEDGRVALFVKGRVRGSWLLTAAYDSAKTTEPGRALHGGIDPDAYYTVYGDQSNRFENAASREKLFVKLEREEATLLFGDFSLDWSTSGFTTYTRDLHGAMAEVRAGPVRVTAFQSDAGLSAVRDELPGAGLSGPYTLSHRGIVPYSERVVIEERDALRPDVIVSTRPLSRNIDYTLDVPANALRLREPLFSHSPARNPQFLVVRYELEDATAGEVLGGRAEYRPSERLTVGAAVITEEHDGETAHVAGIDAQAQIASRLTLSGELARSEGANGAASAYRAEAKHHGEGGETRLYYREVGEGFGLGQLNTSATGNRQFGVEGTQRLSASVSARELAYDETILGTGDRRSAGEVQAEWTLDEWTVRGGARAARDQRASGLEEESLLATSGVSRRLLDGRLELRLDHDQSINGEAESQDFPTSTVLGASYQLTEKTRVLAEQEWTDARGRRTEQTRIGMKSNPWAGGDISGMVAQNRLGSSSTMLGGGVKQTVHLSPDLELEGGFEHARVVSGEIESGPAAGTTPSPFHPTSGFSIVPQGDANALFTGVHWKHRDILYNGRVEYREDDNSRRMLLLASAQAEPGTNLGVVTSLIAHHNELASGRTQYFADARFGAAWRPADGDLIVLNRLDLVRAPLDSTADGHTWKAIENLHASWRPGDAHQLSWHLAGKFASGHFGGLSRDTFTTLAAVEWRRQIHGPWDVGAHGGVLSGWGATTHQFGYGLSVGRAIGDSAWVSLGYNFDGYRDTDFTAARYSAPGVFMRFRMKFDQDSLGGLLRAIKEE